jgi:3-methyladenine DNA glycosylase AlkD
MNLQQTIDEIKAAADPRAVKVWEKIGLDTSKYLGANLTNLKKIAKKIGKNNELAKKLWEAGYHDTKLLATYIADHKKADEDQIDEWIKGVHYWDLADKFAAFVAKTDLAVEKIRPWIHLKNEFLRRTGFMVIYELAKSKKDMNIDFEEFLPDIERALADGENFVRDGANYALIAIGSRTGELNKKCIEIAENAGDLNIVIGGSCNAPDAREKLNDPKTKAKLKG